MVKDHHLLESLALTLTIPESSLLKMALSSVETVLSIGSTLADPNPYAQRLEALHILETLEDLQTHKSQKIYEAAYNILREFFDEDDEEGDDDEVDSMGDEGGDGHGPAALGLGPSSGSESQFSFSNSQPFFQM